MSTKITYPLDSIDGKTRVYDKFDAIRDEIDNGAENYDSDLVFKKIFYIKKHLKTKKSRRKRTGKD